MLSRAKQAMTIIVDGTFPGVNKLYENLYKLRLYNKIRA